jgi:hypothetical protein
MHLPEIPGELAGVCDANRLRHLGNPGFRVAQQARRQLHALLEYFRLDATLVVGGEKAGQMRRADAHRRCHLITPYRLVTVIADVAQSQGQMIAWRTAGLLLVQIHGHRDQQAIGRMQPAVLRSQFQDIVRCEVPLQRADQDGICGRDQMKVHVAFVMESLFSHANQHAILL